LAKKTRTLTVRRVQSVEDRNRSQFLSLSRTGDDFKGFALFTPDPELEDNLGYFEYFDHWDTKNNSYVPCAGPDVCPYCRVNDRPSTRAKTLWLVEDEIKIFTLNWSVINEFADMYSEDEPILGHLFRIKRLDDRGKYRITPKTDSLTKKKLKEIMGSDELPDLEDITTANMQRSLEDIDVASVMEADEDDDDDEDEKPKARRGKEKEDDDDDNAGDTDEDLDDEDVTVAKVSKKNDEITVENEDDEEIVIGVGEFDIGDFKKGMEITVSTDYDDDEEEHTLGAWEEQGGEEEKEEEEDDDKKGDDLPKKIKNEEMTVTEVNAEDETLDLKSDDYEFTLFFVDEGEASEVDFGDYDEDDVVIVNAIKDDDGDMVATKIPEPKKAKKETAKKSSAKKKSTAKKKTAKKKAAAKR